MRVLKRNKPQEDKVNVSGIVVKTTKEHMQEVIDSINSVDCCEVHFSDSEGKIVVTIEGESINDQMDRFKRIQDLPFVFSANLSFSYCEDELAGSLKEIKAHERPCALD
jgi:nitrate reductase NapD